ncbi:MAG: hypothetical protein KAJ49_08360 [Arcobacteraceae bacterium]|nr:hypothetical protein [Arcobacteraceae bacterium]
MKELEFKTVSKYEFVKIGKAKICDIPLKAKGVSDNYKLVLDFIDIPNKQELLKAEQSSYLVYEEDKLIYVGYYAGSFKDRWLREQNNNFYFWHSGNIDDYVNTELTRNPKKEFTLWLTINPYAKTIDNKIFNISKFIEDTLIIEHQPSKNTTGKDLEYNQNGTIPVHKIIGIKIDK